MRACQFGGQAGVSPWGFTVAGGASARYGGDTFLIMAAVHRTLVLALWGAASVAGGVTAGAWFGLSGRQLVFPAMVVFGVYALVAVRFLERDDGAGAAKGSVATALSLRPPRAVLPADHLLVSLSSPTGPERDLVGELTARGRALSSGEARGWLDEFLVQQQS